MDLIGSISAYVALRRAIVQAENAARESVKANQVLAEALESLQTEQRELDNSRSSQQAAHYKP